MLCSTPDGVTAEASGFLLTSNKPGSLVRSMNLCDAKTNLTNPTVTGQIVIMQAGLNFKHTMIDELTGLVDALAGERKDG